MCIRDRECDIRLIPLTDTVISKMLESSSAYTSEVIPAGTYTCLLYTSCCGTDRAGKVIALFIGKLRKCICK